MTDLRKAAEMALEALEYHQEQTRPIQKTQETIDDLRAALAQPEQEPVAWEKSYDIVCALLRQAHDILATTQYPIKRPWVSLTDEELSGVYNEHYNEYVSDNVGIVDVFVIARAIEAALRSKNNG